MILPKIRDKRLITVRRGGTLTDDDHRLLAIWAAECSEHVLHFFEEVCPDDKRPRHAIEITHAWVKGEVKMMEAKAAAGTSNDAAREQSGAAKFAALSAGQAAVVAHVAAHELGAAAYAIRAAMAAVQEEKRESARLSEYRWQVSRLPEGIRVLVLEDMQLRNDICWNVFG